MDGLIYGEIVLVTFKWIFAVTSRTIISAVAKQRGPINKDKMEDLDVPLFPEAPAVTVERTLAIIKPDAIHLADQIVEEIKSRGFTILQVRLRLHVSNPS